MAETNKEHFAADSFERRDAQHDNDIFDSEKPTIPVCPLHDKRDILFSGITTSVDGILKLAQQIRNSQLEEITARADMIRRVSSVEKHIGFTAKIIIGLCAIQMIEIILFAYVLIFDHIMLIP